jgi:hypothetical protein
VLAPDPERQVQFLFNTQRLLSDGSFVATYKFALLLSVADLAVERGDDTTEALPLDTIDIAEKYVELYWRQVLPWVHTPSGTSGVLRQATGEAAAILNLIGGAHVHHGGADRPLAARAEGTLGARRGRRASPASRREPGIRGHQGVANR